MTNLSSWLRAAVSAGLLAFPSARGSLVAADFNDLFNPAGAAGNALREAGTNGVIGDADDQPAGTGTGFEADNPGTASLNEAHWQGNTAFARVYPGDLTAPAGTGYALSQGGTPQHVSTTSTFQRGISRTFATPLAGTVWFSFLALNEESNDRAGFGFNAGAANVAPGITRRLQLHDDGLYLQTVSGPVVNTSTSGGGAGGLAHGEVHLVLGRLVINGAGSNDLLDLWVDPLLSGGPAGLPAPYYSSGPGGLDFLGGSTALTQITVFGYDFRQGISGAGESQQGGRLDAVRLSDALDPQQAFLAVTGVVPEPGTAALFLLGLAPLLRRARRG
jgi:hypothetical protein